MIRKFALAAALLVVEAAAAAPRSIADCEGIEAADAYNRCLASFGPARGGDRSFGAAGESRHYYARRHPQTRSGISIEHGRGGRMRMVLEPGRRGR